MVKPPPIFDRRSAFSATPSTREFPRNTPRTLKRAAFRYAMTKSYVQHPPGPAASAGLSPSRRWPPRQRRRVVAAQRQRLASAPARRSLLGGAARPYRRTAARAGGTCVAFPAAFGNTKSSGAARDQGPHGEGMAKAGRLFSIPRPRVALLRDQPKRALPRRPAFSARPERFALSLQPLFSRRRRCRRREPAT